MHGRHLFLLGIVLTRIAAADAAPTEEVIAARFITTTCAQPCVTPKAGDWYLWRGENRVEVRAASGEVGEIWRRDGQGRVNFVFVEPGRKRGIEYNTTDLRMIGHKRPWERLAGIVSPMDLEKLAPAGETEVLGHKARRYAGKLGKRAMEVVWLPDLQLAARVSVTDPDRQVTTELKAFLEGETPAAISDKALADFQLVDFADVGDMETNPSMTWLKQAMAAPGHEHHDH